MVGKVIPAVCNWAMGCRFSEELGWAVRADGRRDECRVSGVWP